VRLFNLANGLKDYGKGFHYARLPVYNFLFLWYRFLEKQLLRTRAYLGQQQHPDTEYTDDIRALIRHGSSELASAHVMYTHEPNHFDFLERNLRGFRMWGPRRCIEDARDAQQWYLPAELFEEYFVPQIELRMMLEFNKAPIIYNADRKRWSLSSFKDENNEHI